VRREIAAKAWRVSERLRLHVKYGQEGKSDFLASDFVAAAWSGFCVSTATAQSSQPRGGNKSSMEQQIVAKEREGLDGLKIRDLARFGDLTADDAVFADAKGLASKAEILRNVGGFRVVEYSGDKMEFRAISKNTGLIVYKITEKGTSHGKEFAAQVYVSSIWTQRNGKWVCLFSQEPKPQRPVYGRDAQL
jgi:ketosteroid isomerase-like protein